MKNNQLYLLSRNSDKSFVDKDFGSCDACGGIGPYRFKEVINQKLSKEWNLDKIEKNLWSSRESMFCMYCGCSFRLRSLARAINIHVNNIRQTNFGSLSENIENGGFNDLRVLEINSCGVLHEILKKIPKMTYTEYISADPAIPSEDIQNLSFANNSFDIILNSDVLEHIPYPRKAFEEMSRVLKKSGIIIITIPLKMYTDTIIRTKLIDNKPIAILNNSFHGSGEPDYLVWNEFGADFIQEFVPEDLVARYLFVNKKNLKEPNGVIAAIKTGSNFKYAYRDNIKNYNTLNDQNIKMLKFISDKNQLTNNHISNLSKIIEDNKIQLTSLTHFDIRKYSYGNLLWRLLVKLILDVKHFSYFVKRKIKRFRPII